MVRWTLAVTLVVGLVATANADEQPPQARASREQREARAQRAIAPLFSRRDPPRPGEWLASHHEEGQTFEEFRAASEYRNFSRKTLYIQPIGALSAKQLALLDDIEVALRVFFGKPTKRLPPIDDDAPGTPITWRRNPHTGAVQLSTRSILEHLEPTVPQDAQAVLALTATDLWPGNDWNYLFGQASFDKPVGVWSIARMGDPEKDYARTLARALKLALHETGHMFGLKHCTAYRCGMSGTNNLAETDRAPMAFCPECERKLWWALGLDIERRYAGLIAFAKARGLAHEAMFWALVRHRLQR